MDSADLHTDGNALAGVFQDVFATEMTTAKRHCASCGQEHAIGAHRLYSGAGAVLRCPNCGDVGAVVVELPDQYVLTLQGGWRLPRRAG
jgi:predicted RNA-binding Zn-ribbon protein involved in translation (DUF1610 family)